jgi:hypothetical protein
MNPKYWGKYFWRVIHIVAMSYPLNPTIQDKKTYRDFYFNIGRVLPCSKCMVNYERHFQNIPIDYFLQSRDMLFKWTVHLHNIVNKETGKPQWSLEYAWSYYKSSEKNVSIEGYHAYSSKLMILVNVIVILIILFILWKKL